MEKCNPIYALLDMAEQCCLKIHVLHVSSCINSTASETDTIQWRAVFASNMKHACSQW